MKQKIKVDIHKSGNCNADILAMVAENNGTGPYVSMSDIKGLLKYSRIKWPTTYAELTYSKDSGYDILLVPSRFQNH